MENGTAIPGIINTTMPPPPPVPISLPRAWVDVLIHPKSERFRQWFPWISHRWMVASFALSTVLVVLTGTERAILVLILPAHPTDVPKMPHAVFIFASHIVGSVGTTFAMALGVALIMDRAYGPLRIRFREYVLRPWLLAQPAICAVLLLGYPLNAWYARLNLDSSALPGFFAQLLNALFSIPFWYSLLISYEAFCAGSGRDRVQIVYMILLPVAFVVFLLTWVLPAFIAAHLGYPLA